MRTIFLALGFLLIAQPSSASADSFDPRLEDIVSHLDEMDPGPGFEPVAYVVKEPEAPRFTWRQKISPIFWLGNADSPTPPEWYDPNGRFRDLKWYLRNPGHNFTHYVIGVSDKASSSKFVRVGKYPKDVFAPVQGWNYAVIRYGAVRLPFVSYWDRHIRFYIGWRRTGNFGIKLNHGVDKNP